MSVSAGEGRGPLTVPMWYQYAPGGEPWVLTSPGSRKARLIEAAGYFALMAERVEPSVRYVAVDGPVSRIEPATDEQLVEMTRRYLPPEKVDAYLDYARRVSRIEPATDEQLVEMTRRYLPPEKVDAYLDYARREHGEQIAIYLRPQHWLSSDLGSL